MSAYANAYNQHPGGAQVQTASDSSILATPESNGYNPGDMKNEQVLGVEKGPIWTPTINCGVVTAQKVLAKNIQNLPTPLSYTGAASFTLPGIDPGVAGGLTEGFQTEYTVVSTAGAIAINFPSTDAFSTYYQYLLGIPFSFINLSTVASASTIVINLPAGVTIAGTANTTITIHGVSTGTFMFVSATQAVLLSSSGTVTSP